MRRIASSCLFTACLVFTLSASGQTHSAREVNLTLDSLKGLEVIDGQAEVGNYHGQRAIHFAPLAAPKSQQATPPANRIALVNDFDFKNGTIEVDVAGTPGPEAASDDRGFIGVLFRGAGARRESGKLLFASDQRARERPVAAQPFRPI